MRRALALALVVASFAVVVADDPPAPVDPAKRKAALQANDEGVKLLEAGEAEKALEKFREAKELLPDDPTIRGNGAKAHAWIARKLYDDRKYREAAREWHEAASLDPSELDHAHGEGVALAQAGEDRDAAAVLERVAAADPARRPTLVALGHCLYKLGKLKAAVTRWTRALELDPKDETLAKALEKAKREAQVEEALDEDLGAPHFAIRVDGGKDLALARLVGRLLEDAYRDVGYDLGRYPKGEVPVVIYPRKTFRQATNMHEWVAASFDGKIRVPAEGLDRADPRAAKAVLVHEFTHALVRSIGGPDVPAWLHEGLAQLVEGRSRPEAREKLGTAQVPTLKELGGSFVAEKDERLVVVRYAAALDLVGHLADRPSGRRGIVDVLERTAKGETLDVALKAVAGCTTAELHESWRASIRR